MDHPRCFTRGVDPIRASRAGLAAMLDGMLTSLGFQHVTVTFGGSPAR